MARKDLEDRVIDLEERVRKLERLANALQKNFEAIPPEVYAERKGL